MDSSVQTQDRPSGGGIRLWLQRAERLVRAHPALVLLGLFAFYCAVVFLAPTEDVSLNDEPVFIGYAKRMLHLHYATRAGYKIDFLWFGPGLPTLLTPFVALHLPVTVMRLVSPVLLVAAVYLLYRLLKLYVSERSALVGATVLAIYYPVWRLLPRVFSEPLAMVLLLLFAYFCTRYIREGRRRFLVAAGVALAGVAMTRLEYGWVIVGCIAIGAVWLLIARNTLARRSLATFALAGVLCLPWLGYTYHVTHKPLYWGNSGGLSLYWMASPYGKDLGEPHTMDDVFNNPNLAEHRKFFTHLGHIGPVAADEALRRAASRDIKRHPGLYAKRLAFNFSRLWFRTPFSFQGFGGAKTLFYAVPGVLLLLTLIVAASRFVRTRAWPPGELAPVLLVVALGFGVHLVAAGYPRSIAPLVPEFILFAAIGLTATRAVAEPAGARSGPGRLQAGESLTGARPVAASPTP